MLVYYLFFLFSIGRDGDRFYLDGIESIYLEDAFSLASKWTSICVAFDFSGDRWEYLVNGKRLKYKRTSYLRPLNGRMSDDKDLPMVVRLGHYYFDNKPIIGKMIDFHLWDR